MCEPNVLETARCWQRCSFEALCLNISITAKYPKSTTISAHTDVQIKGLSEGTDTLVFVDVDGVLNVGVADGDSTLDLNKNNIGKLEEINGVPRGRAV